MHKVVLEYYGEVQVKEMITRIDSLREDLKEPGLGSFSHQSENNATCSLFHY